MPFIFLTDEDHRLLKDMINDRKGGRVNSPSRSSQLFSEQDANHQAPEVYVAMTPVDGIPARVDTTPGSADCNIYRIVNDLLEKVFSFTHKVYNLKDSDIDGDSYISVKRDKYGTWLADTGGGGSSIVMFSITDSDECGSGCVDATVELLACGLSSIAVGDPLVITDEAGCFFNVDPVFLLGVKGFAVKMDGSNDCDPYDTEACHWVVVSLCCTLGGCP
jgi:hypothetical protein